MLVWKIFSAQAMSMQTILVYTIQIIGIRDVMILAALQTGWALDLIKVSALKAKQPINPDSQCQKVDWMFYCASLLTEDNSEAPGWLARRHRKSPAVDNYAQPVDIITSICHRVTGWARFYGRLPDFCEPK